MGLLCLHPKVFKEPLSAIRPFAELIGPRSGTDLSDLPHIGKWLLGAIYQ